MRVDMKKVELSIALSLLITIQTTAKYEKHNRKDEIGNSVDEDARFTFFLWDTLQQGMLVVGSISDDPTQLYRNKLKMGGQAHLIDDDDSQQLSTEQQLSHKYGYPSESHRVTTTDGYILTVHRIPYKRECTYGYRRPPVLVLHGLLCSSIDWIIMGPGKSLGYILADNCYDVWLGNSRGNAESKRHVSMKPRDRDFWNFSWHEMGVYDLPAVINHISQETGRSDLHYIGHSQGTTQFFIFASMYPEYAKRIRSMQALAPVAYMGNLKRPVIQALSYFHGPIEKLVNMVGLYEFLPRTEFLVKLGSEACKDKYPKLQAVCSNILFLICGYDSEQLNYTMLPAIMGHTPAGASTRQLIHYAQSIKSGKFRQYDYGKFENYYNHYNSVNPPDYDIEKIEVPIALYYSDNDRLVDVRDVIRLEKEIPHVITTYRVPYKKFNHLDYMYAKDARKFIYDKVLDVLTKY